MAWTKNSFQRGSKSYIVASETLTSKEATVDWTSEINFIPPGQDFSVITNTAATNTSASTHAELFVAYESGAAVAKRYRRNATPWLPVTAEIDTVTKVHVVDVSSVGEVPFYYIKIPSGGGSVNIRVITQSA